jgi:hypothetical protein
MKIQQLIILFLRAEFVCLKQMSVIEHIVNILFKNLQIARIETLVLTICMF